MWKGEEIDAAMRHADPTADLPWSAMSPDEAMMAREEVAQRAEQERKQERGHAWLQKALLEFAFADGDPLRWEPVALRMYSLMVKLVPSLVMGRDLDEVHEVRRRVGRLHGTGLQELVAMCEGEVTGERIHKLLEWWYPQERTGWLVKGTKRVYLMARAFQPDLVSVKGLSRDRKRELRRDLTYTELAEVFGEPGGTKRARGRWCGLRKRLITEPVEEAGGRVQLHFGKSASTVAKYRAAQLGNQNRKGGGKG